MGVEYGSFEPLLETLRKNIHEVESALITIHSERIEEYEDQEVPPEFDREKLALGEMRLCRAVFESGPSNLLRKLNFSPKIGKAQVFDATGSVLMTRWHNFYLDSTGLQVVDITAGQLQCKGRIPSYKGEMLDEMQEKAPDHILRLSEEVMITYGSLEEIDKIFGFRLEPVWN